MRLKLERGDAHWTRKSNAYDVLDEVTGKCVGSVSVDRTPRHKSYPTYWQLQHPRGMCRLCKGR
jgi:hypothetical protein